MAFVFLCLTYFARNLGIISERGIHVVANDKYFFLWLNLYTHIYILQFYYNSSIDERLGFPINGYLYI